MEVFVVVCGCLDRILFANVSESQRQIKVNFIAFLYGTRGQYEADRRQQHVALQAQRARTNVNRLFLVVLVKSENGEAVARRPASSVGRA